MIQGVYTNVYQWTAAEPPSLSMKLVNENDPGLEFAGASMLPDDEVVSGEDRAKGIEGSHSSRSIKTGRACGAVRRVHPGWPARWGLESRAAAGRRCPASVGFGRGCVVGLWLIRLP